MSILVVGSIGIDSVETPEKKVDYSLGGSALYFSNAASFFSPINLVGVVGSDFDFSEIEYLKKRRVNLDGVQVENGKTFAWGGKYHVNMNSRDTLFTHLNVFENFRPVIPPAYCDSQFIFLANIDPLLQLEVLRQVKRPRLAVLDTMNFWISRKRKDLMEVIRRVDVVILNEEELKELSGRSNIFEGAHQLLKEGPKALVIKKGEHGAVLVDEESYFLAPAYPVARVVDPTGAGDSFAGGFLGYLSTCPQIDDPSLRKAVVYGTITASFTVEDFSFNRLKHLSLPEIEARVAELRQMVAF